jgi:hypothetical protein
MEEQICKEHEHQLQINHRRSACSLPSSVSISVAPGDLDPSFGNPESYHRGNSGM